METNTHTSGELHDKAIALIAAAEDYWTEYQRTLRPSAVVWLKADNGQMVLFTRGEYISEIMAAVDRINRTEPPLETLFTIGD